MKGLRTFWVAGVVGRCPSCGRTSMFSGFYDMHERCSVCDLRFAPASGEWVGATALGYGIGAVIAIALALIEVAWGPIQRMHLDPMWTIAVISLVATAIGYRWAKSMWFALLYEWGFMAYGDQPPGPSAEG